MDSKPIVSADPSIMLWLAAALVALLGMRAFLEYLRRVGHQAPLAGWLDLVLAAVALASCTWSTIIVGIAGQGISYPVGYSIVGLVGTLVLGIALAMGPLAWVAWRPGWVSLGAGSLLIAAVTLLMQIGVIRAIGAEPGITWRWSMLGAAGVTLFAGSAVSMRFVVGIRRASRNDTSVRRLVAALWAALALIGAQECTLLAASLPEQSVSAYTRQIPEIVAILIAVAAMPIAFVVMMVDQYMQRRIRAATRRQSRRLRLAAASAQTPVSTQTSGLTPPVH